MFRKVMTVCTGSTAVLRAFCEGDLTFRSIKLTTGMSDSVGSPCGSRSQFWELCYFRFWKLDISCLCS